MASSKAASNLSTILSSKGQIIIPKSVRAAHRWEAGLMFELVDTEEGLLLKPATLFPARTLKSVAGMLKDSVKSLSDEEIAESLARDIRSRWRDRD